MIGGGLGNGSGKTLCTAGACPRPMCFPGPLLIPVTTAVVILAGVRLWRVTGHHCSLQHLGQCSDWFRGRGKERLWGDPYLW